LARRRAAFEDRCIADREYSDRLLEQRLRAPTWVSAVLAATALLATSVLSNAGTTAVAGYVGASKLAGEPPTSSYLPPPPARERERFSVAELRAAITGTAHDGYVDLGRFHALERAPGR
jgi:hypothetical protein